MLTAPALADEVECRGEIACESFVLLIRQSVLLFIVDDTTGYRNGEKVTAGFKIVSDGEAMRGGEMSVVEAVLHGSVSPASNGWGSPGHDAAA